MPKIQLLDGFGAKRTYDTENVSFETPEGGRANFTYGERASVTMEPDFSAGAVTVTPESGKVLERVTISKPENLEPGNIAEGVEVAGIIGTHSGGGGGDSEWSAYNSMLSGIVKEEIEGTDDTYVLTWCFRILKERRNV